MPRRPQAQRPVDTHWRQPSEAAANAHQALPALTHGLRTSTLPDSLIRSTSRYSLQGRPWQGAPPAPGVYLIEGALALSLAAHEALIAQQSCFILAT
jgi:hypothetical protein